MIRLILIFTCNLNCVADVHFKILLSLCKAWSFVMKMFEALMAFELPIKRYFISNVNRMSKKYQLLPNVNRMSKKYQLLPSGELVVYCFFHTSKRTNRTSPFVSLLARLRAPDRPSAGACSPVPPIVRARVSPLTSARSPVFRNYFSGINAIVT